MENYTKGRNVEHPLERDKLPFKDLPVNFLWMQVKGGSKLNNLISHALSILEDGSTKVVVWSGAGAGLGKAISCAEITKRTLKIDHQISKINYQNIDEYWDPKVEALETLVVKRQIPVIHIQQSLSLLDSQAIGYQSLTGQKFWLGTKTNSKKPQVSYGKRKQPKKSSDNTF